MVSLRALGVDVGVHVPGAVVAHVDILPMEAIVLDGDEHPLVPLVGEVREDDLVALTARLEPEDLPRVAVGDVPRARARIVNAQ